MIRDEDKMLLYTVPEASRVIGWHNKHKTRLKYYVDRGVIPSQLIGETPYISEKTIKDLIDGVSFPIIKNDEDK